jgi:ABC-type transport system involved in cytochrome c biogenesis permease component
MRWNMLSTLVRKDWGRLAKNIPALMLIGMIVALALLLATSQSKSARPLDPCWIVFWEEGAWLDFLKERLPQNTPVVVMSHAEAPKRGDEIKYPAGVHSIEVRPSVRGSDGVEHPQVWYLYSGSDRNVLWPYTQWFWSNSAEYLGGTEPFVQRVLPIRGRSSSLGPRNLREASVAELVAIETVGSLLLFFGLFFTCCHLLVSSTSQERERGTLLALALTPARLREIFCAKVMFHLMLALGLSGVVTSVLRPGALLQPVHWATLFVAALGYIAVGLSISSLVRTQATAGLLTLSYMLFVGVLFYLAQEYSAVSFVQQFTFEQYFFALAYINLKFPVGLTVPHSFWWLATISVGWLAMSGYLFISRGWR